MLFVFVFSGQAQIMALGVSLLEGKDISGELSSAGESVQSYGRVCPAVASLIWYANL